MKRAMTTTAGKIIQTEDGKKVAVKPDIRKKRWQSSRWTNDLQKLKVKEKTELYQTLDQLNEGLCWDYDLLGSARGISSSMITPSRIYSVQAQALSDNTVIHM